MKSKTLYGLNWAKADIAKKDQVVVCEGYTDVIGFHRAGVPRAVATCGTALTEEHVRLLKRYASKVVLSFDADAAGQGAAERFYEWEEKHKVEVLVAQLPDGKDPGDLASSQPEALVAAVDKPVPFLKFRLGRTMRGRPKDSPEHRVRLAEDAMAVVNEHPKSRSVCFTPAKLLLSCRCRSATWSVWPSAEPDALRFRSSRSDHEVRYRTQSLLRSCCSFRIGTRSHLGCWWSSFDDDVNRMAFIALGEAGGDLSKAIEIAPPDAVDILERAAVADLNLIADVEARTLIGAACRRELQQRVRVIDPEGMAEDRQARLDVEALQDTESTRALAAAESLLGWLHRRSEERSDGEH